MLMFAHLLIGRSLSVSTEDDDFLQAMHNLLLDIHVIDGFLICPETGRRFPIAERIPDMR